MAENHIPVAKTRETEPSTERKRVKYGRETKRIVEKGSEERHRNKTK